MRHEDRWFGSENHPETKYAAASAAGAASAEIELSRGRVRTPCSIAKIVGRRLIHDRPGANTDECPSSGAARGGGRESSGCGGGDLTHPTGRRFPDPGGQAGIPENSAGYARERGPEVPGDGRYPGPGTTRLFHEIRIRPGPWQVHSRATRPRSDARWPCGQATGVPEVWQPFGDLRGEHPRRLNAGNFPVPRSHRSGNHVVKRDFLRPTPDVRVRRVRRKSTASGYS